MSAQAITNSQSRARLFLRRLYEKVGESGKGMTPLEYGQIAREIGFDSVELSEAIQALRRDLFIAYPNSTTEIIVLTSSGVQRADYLRFRQEFPLVGDPLPDSLDGVQAELRLWAQERPKHLPNSNEWQLIEARIQDLRHLENSMPRPSFGASEIRSYESKKSLADVGFLQLLHPSIIASSYEQFQNGHLRDAVLNSIVAVFDLIRERTGLDMDGSNLVNKALSLSDPFLVLSDLKSESGQNDQKGFIQILTGSYQGIRNTKAHSLENDLTDISASQYLVFASLLARRISEARTLKMGNGTAN